MEPNGRPVGTGERAGLVIVLVLAAAARAPTLAQPLLEVHAFRQTQTAYTAVLFARDGIDLLHPRVPVLGPPYVLPFELPLFQALATIPIRLGLAPDMSLRLTGLACFLAAALLLWSLVRRSAGAPAAFATLVAFLFSPLALLWSRTAMIDYLAVAAALGYLLLGLAWRDGGSRWLWVLALVTGIAAMAVKLQSAAFWIVPLVAYRARRRGRGDPWLLTLVLVPLAAALLWTRYADALRASSPGSAWMTATGLTPFLLGALDERLSLDAWAPLAYTVLAWGAGPALAVLVPFVVPAVRSDAQPLFWSALVLAPLASVLVFFHVWSTHNYYAIAATPAIAVAVGLGAAGLWHSARVRSRVLARGLLVAAAGALVAGLVVTVDYWGRAYATVATGSTYLSDAAELEGQSAPTEAVLMAGDEWSPAVLYYAHRQGQMLPEPLQTSEFVASLHAAGYRTFFSWQPATDPLWPAAAWRWVGALAPHTYALADALSGLRGARAASSDDIAAYAGATAGGRALVDRPVSIRCGAVSELPAGTDRTWVRLAPTDRDARVFVSNELAALPARAVLVVSSAEAKGGAIRLGCAGTDALTVIAAVDAP